MLPTNELNRLRNDIKTALLDTCNILTSTAAADGMGGQSLTWGTASVSVACRFDQRGGREQQAGGGMDWYTTNMLTVAHDTTIAVGYRVEYGGTTYRVTNINEGSGLAVKRAILERV